MIVEMRTYVIKPMMLKKFIAIYNNDIRETHVNILGNQIGFFYTEYGDLNNVIHLYGYTNHEDRDMRRAKLSENKDFLNYLDKVKDLIVNMKNEILIPTEFSKIR